jgi:uncharacterized DUF497 family protein
MTEVEDVLRNVTGFEWDEGNREKNWVLHQVRSSEVEEVFAQRPLLIAPDEKHSGSEVRYAAWGQTASGRQLAVVFTIRESRIRVVSARDMSRGERREFEHGTKAEADPEVR